MYCIDNVLNAGLVIDIYGTEWILFCDVNIIIHNGLNNTQNLHLQILLISKLFDFFPLQAISLFSVVTLTFASDIKEGFQI